MDTRRKGSTIAAISRVLPNGELVEAIHRKENQETKFLHWHDRKAEEKSWLSLGERRRLFPYSPDNNLLTHDVVLLPSGVAEYGSEADLVAEVRDFIHRYVDVSPDFEAIASHYVLFTWLYDAFSEVPYLRVRGDYGTGKSRFLLTLGSLCYKPIFASGASTVSPLFRIMDALGGTLVIDEADFRASDEKAEVTKILNNGNAKGFPVLRSQGDSKGEFKPRAFTIFGPKLIATRNGFDDPALESRCITEEMNGRLLRSDIPINLPKRFHLEAERLRNKLLLFRFRTFDKISEVDEEARRLGDPRVSQILGPLFSIVRDEKVRKSLESIARKHSQTLRLDRSFEVEAQVLQAIKELRREKATLSLRTIAEKFREDAGAGKEEWVTPRWIGSILRKRLFLSPMKSRGVYVLPRTEYPKLDALFERYDLSASGSLGTSGTSQEGVAEEVPPEDP